MSSTDKNLLDPGFELTLRPMRYPDFYERYRDAIKNTWTVEEVDLHSDVADLAKLTPAEQHMIGRLVAFFATGDSIVSNNLVLTLYKHINSPEARLYLSRQLFEEAVHVQFYLTLLDTYLPDPDDRAAAFDAVEEIPSIREKAQFCFKWMDSVEKIDRLETKADRRRFLLNLICFAACIEGLFFYGAFAYVYWFRSRGLLHGLATGTNWVFRDETMHMNFAFEVVDTVRKEEPELFDDALQQQVTDMLKEAVEAELQFGRDLCGDGLPGMNTESMREYLECVADQRLVRLGFPAVYGSQNPFSFMELQGVQELTNFFERRPSAYQVAVEGTVDLDEDFSPESWIVCRRPPPDSGGGLRRARGRYFLQVTSAVADAVLPCEGPLSITNFWVRVAVVAPAGTAAWSVTVLTSLSPPENSTVPDTFPEVRSQWNWIVPAPEPARLAVNRMPWAQSASPVAGVAVTCICPMVTLREVFPFWRSSWPSFSPTLPPLAWPSLKPTS